MTCQAATGSTNPLISTLPRSRYSNWDPAIVLVPCDKAVQAGNGLVNAAPVTGDDCTEIFGIELRGERGRSDQVAKQDRQLTAFDRARAPCCRCPRACSHAQFAPAVSTK